MKLESGGIRGVRFYELNGGRFFFFGVCDFSYPGEFSVFCRGIKRVQPPGNFRIISEP
jgi:hypothetical protein